MSGTRNKQSARTGRPSTGRRSGAFTLVELILVMAILTVTISLVVPSLSRFFAGRSLDSEVQRLLALTRYGQSRAVSEGVPMMLWLDPQAGAYGLEQEAGYSDKDAKAEDFALARDIKLDVPTGSKPSTAGSKQFAIFFSPDGAPVADTSVSRVSLTKGTDRPVWIALSANRMTYEVRYQ